MNFTELLYAGLLQQPMNGDVMQRRKKPARIYLDMDKLLTNLKSQKGPISFDVIRVTVDEDPWTNSRIVAAGGGLRRQGHIIETVYENGKGSGGANGRRHPAYQYLGFSGIKTPRVYKKASPLNKNLNTQRHGDPVKLKTFMETQARPVSLKEIMDANEWTDKRSWIAISNMRKMGFHIETASNGLVGKRTARYTYIPHKPRTPVPLVTNPDYSLFAPASLELVQPEPMSEPEPVTVHTIEPAVLEPVRVPNAPKLDLKNMPDNATRCAYLIAAKRRICDEDISQLLQVNQKKAIAIAQDLFDRYEGDYIIKLSIEAA